MSFYTGVNLAESTLSVGTWAIDKLEVAGEFYTKAAIDAGTWTIDKLVVAGEFWGEKITAGTNEYLRKRDLGDSALNKIIPNDTFMGFLVNEVIRQDIGYLVDYKVDLNSKWIAYINQNSNVISWNGISNKESEGTPPAYEVRTKDFHSPVAMYEGNNVGADIGSIAADELLDVKVVTNQVKQKTAICVRQLDSSIKKQGLTDLAYSGSWVPNLKELKYLTEENKDIVALVGIGGVSIRGSWFTEKMYNPNLKVIVNIWGDQDVFYKSPGGLVGPKKFEGVPYFNVMILGADHGSYLNNDNKTDIWSMDVVRFVRDITSAANRGGYAVKVRLNSIGVQFDPESMTYIVDINKMYNGDRKK
jgi:hypothetical protein